MPASRAGPALPQAAAAITPLYCDTMLYTFFLSLLLAVLASVPAMATQELQYAPIVLRADSLPMNITGKPWLVRWDDDADNTRRDRGEGWSVVPVLMGDRELHPDVMNGRRATLLRCEFVVDKSLEGRPVALLISQSGASEIWLNGQKIQDHGTTWRPGREEKSWNPQFFPLLLDFDTAAVQVLTIRYTADIHKAIPSWLHTITPPTLIVQVGDAEAVVRRLDDARRKTGRSYWFDLGVLFALVIFHSMLYALRRGDTLQLWFALMALLLCCILGGWISAFVPIRSELLVFWAVAVLICWNLTFVVFSAIVAIMHEGKLPRWFPVHVAGVAVVFTMLPFGFELQAWMIFAALSVAESSRRLVLMLRRKQPGSILLLVGMLFFFLHLALWALCFALGLFSMPLWLWEIIQHLGILGIPLMISTYLAGNVARTSKRLEEQIQEIQTLSARALSREREAQELAVQRKVLELDNERKTKELELARALQLRMRPREMPATEWLDTYAAMWTAAEVGGDYYDALPYATGYAMAVGDATGHGSPAGMMVATVKGFLHSVGADTMPSDILSALSHTIRSMQFRGMYMCLALIKAERKAITYAGTGLPAMVVWRAATKTTEEYSLKGIPLGAMKSGNYADKVLDMNAGDVAVVITDGLPELMDEQRRELGYHSVASLVAEAIQHSHSAQQIVEYILRKAKDWNKQALPNDDVTIVCLRYTE